MRELHREDFGLDHVLLNDAWLGPDNRWLLAVVLVLLVTGALGLLHFRVSARRPSATLKRWGVPLNHVKRALREIERKTFHLCGLLVPLSHLMLLKRGWSNASCVSLCWALTVVGCCCDVARLRSPWVARHWPLKAIMREHEARQLTGGCFFSLGCALSMSLSPPSVAMCSILFLVLGDMAAALIGVSFGGEVAQVKLGRLGKKSIEGSLAMFSVCFLVGCLTFAEVPLREYFVFGGALVATLTELYEPLGLNDNLTIPVCSALALQIGLLRVLKEST